MSPEILALREVTRRGFYRALPPQLSRRRLRVLRALYDRRLYLAWAGQPVGWWFPAWLSDRVAGFGHNPLSLRAFWSLGSDGLIDRDQKGRWKINETGIAALHGELADA